MKTINRHNLNIAALASKEESRYTLSSVYITPDMTIETDGHQLVIVTTQAIDRDNSGDIDGVKATDEFEPFLLPAKKAAELAAAIPGKFKVGVGRKEQTVKGRCAAVVADKTNQNGSAIFGVTDADSQKVFSLKKAAGKFPDHTKVVPEKKGATLSVCVSLDVLMPVLRQMEKFCTAYGKAKPVMIRFYDATSEQEMTAVVMPMRPADDTL
jgi:hypothetical protein